MDPLKADFRNFLYAIWKHLGLPDPTEVQYDIAHYLQNGPRRIVIEAFRGVGKSWITVAFVCWLLYCNPELKIEVVSASKSLAANFTTFCLQLINNVPFLKHLAPREGQRSSKEQFDVGPCKESKDPSVKSVGISGQITGTRADCLVADDIEVPNNSLTQAGRAKLAEQVKEFDAILKPGGRIIYLGTPQTEESLYNELPKRGYNVRIWPARIPNDLLKKHYGDALAPLVAECEDPEGCPTDPKRFTELELAEREASYGRAGFMLQFMLNTALSDAERFPLKINDLMFLDLDADLAPEKLIYGSTPDLELRDVPNVGFSIDRYHKPLRTEGSWIPYTGCAMSIDPSGRGKDELAYAVGKMLNGTIFIPAAGGLQGGYTEANLKILVEIAKKHKVNKVVVESNFGDGMFTQLIKPLFAVDYPVAIEEVRHSMQKERRIIDTLEPVLQRHKLVFDPEVVFHDFRTAQRYEPDLRRDYMLFYQLSRVTHERGCLRHDDRLDALAILVNYWVEAMAQDVNVNMARRLDDLRDRQLESFLRHAIGGKPAAPKSFISNYGFKRPNTTNPHQGSAIRGNSLALRGGKR